MMAEALPAIMKRALSRAKTVKGDRDRERIMKAAESFPRPRAARPSSIPDFLLQRTEEDGTDEHRGDLESADDFLMKAAKAMHGKGLPPGPVLDEAEIIEIEDEPEE